MDALKLGVRDGILVHLETFHLNRPSGAINDQHTAWDNNVGDEGVACIELSINESEYASIGRRWLRGMRYHESASSILDFCWYAWSMLVLSLSETALAEQPRTLHMPVQGPQHAGKFGNHLDEAHTKSL